MLHLQSDETTLPPPDQSVQTDQVGVDGSVVGPVVKPYQLGERASAAIEEYRQQIDQAARENRDPVMLARYYKDLGDLYVSYNQREQAEAAYRQSLDFDRWWPDTHLALAEVVAARGATTETLQLVQTAVAITSGAVEAQLALARQQDNAARMRLPWKLIKRSPPPILATPKRHWRWRKPGRPTAVFLRPPMSTRRQLP